MYKSSLSALLVLALSGCQAQDVSGSKTEGAVNAGIENAEWVGVTFDTDDKPFFVNKNSIYPYKSDAMQVSKRVEYSSYPYDDASSGVVTFNCETRLYQELGEDGSVSPPIPVQSWSLISRAYNYVCLDFIDSNAESITPVIDVLPSYNQSQKSTEEEK